MGHRDEDGAKRAGKRAVSLGKAVVYGAIGVSALQIAIGAGSSGGGSDSMTTKLMDLPGGSVDRRPVGLAIIGDRHRAGRPGLDRELQGAPDRRGQERRLRDGVRLVRQDRLLRQGHRHRHRRRPLRLCRRHPRPEEVRWPRPGAAAGPRAAVRAVPARPDRGRDRLLRAVLLRPGPAPVALAPAGRVVPVSHVTPVYLLYQGCCNPLGTASNTALHETAGGARLGAMTTHEVDVVVVGLGPGGEALAATLAQARACPWSGVDRRLVGGECPYYGCIPSKMMIRAADALAEARRVDDAGRSCRGRPPTGAGSRPGSATRPPTTGTTRSPSSGWRAPGPVRPRARAAGRHWPGAGRRRRVRRGARRGPQHRHRAGRAADRRPGGDAVLDQPRGDAGDRGAGQPGRHRRRRDRAASSPRRSAGSGSG